MQEKIKKTRTFWDVLQAQFPQNLVLSLGGFSDLSAVRKNFFLNEIAKCADPFALAQFFGVSEKNWNFAAFQIR